MDFAKKQLEKYGWTDGKGLGKNEDGIAIALKPNLKFDNTGIGHEPAEQFTNNWWERVFNNAVNNFSVQVEKDEVKLELTSNESVEITTKNYSVRDLVKKNKRNKNVKYGGCFIKPDAEKCDRIDNHISPQTARNFTNLTDDELLAACGGRTAHKGARHGLNLSGKLSRIEKQEKMLLKKMRNVSISDKKTNLEKKVKKLQKQKDQESLNNNNTAAASSWLLLDDADIDANSCSSSPGKNKSKKKRKSVSFNNETVTNYYYKPECDENSNNNNNNTVLIPSINDEGIEQDLEDNSSEQDDNHKSFEQVQLDFSDLSKVERQKLKKKRKLEKKTTATMKFLDKVNLTDDDLLCVEDEAAAASSKCNKCKKRKLNANDESGKASSSVSMKESKKKKHLSEKRKKKKRKQHEKKMINSISESLDHLCRISSDDE